MTQAKRSRSGSPKPSWAAYRESIGDRSGLFAAVAEQWAPNNALYVGSYLDLSPSTAIPHVTYVDTDSRAARYFADTERVAADLDGRTRPGAGVEVAFISADYTAPIDLPDRSFDLLISLYTGPSWDQVQRYLKPEGLLLANTSHGDASLAALDPGCELVGVVQHRDATYRIVREDLDGYLVPKKPALAEADLIRADGRGVAYTRPAFAYVFRTTSSFEP
ncbi:hypothetical protein GCM10027020_20530 [Nocardioides salsibiostraticola]